MSPRIAKRLRDAFTNVGTWVAALLFFFPLLYMVLTSFKSEEDVIPPSLFIDNPTVENYRTVLDDRMFAHLGNSVSVTLSTVACSLLLGVPAAYAIVFGSMRRKRADNLFFWFLSTTLLPPVSVVVPVYLIFRTLGILDTIFGLVFIYTGIHTPIVIWMTRSFLMDVPKQLIESAAIDGASKVRAFFSIILPLVRSGVASTALLVFVFVWNESFFALNVASVNAATLPVYMASFMTQEGLFWAKLSAIATFVILPPLILGWLSHKQLVKGLTMGAIKG